VKRKSYVKCKNCGLNIQLPFECRFMYPLHFSATCHNCGHTDVYHRLEVIQEDDEFCENELEKVEKRTKPLRDAVTQYLLHSIVYITTQTLIETLKQTLGAIGGVKGDKIKRTKQVSPTPYPRIFESATIDQ